MLSKAVGAGNVSLPGRAWIGVTGFSEQEEVRCSGSCGWVWGCVCRLLALTKSQAEAEAAQIYFMPFFFFSSPSCVAAQTQHF